MKTAIYIEDGLTQLVLTPETDWEKSALRAIDRDSPVLTVRHGSFYLCQGGWNRHGCGEDDESLILRLTSPQPNTPVNL